MLIDMHKTTSKISRPHNKDRQFCCIMPILHKNKQFSTSSLTVISYVTTETIRSPWTSLNKLTLVMKATHRVTHLLRDKYIVEYSLPKKSHGCFAL